MHIQYKNIIIAKNDFFVKPFPWKLLLAKNPAARLDKPSVFNYNLFFRAGTGCLTAGNCPYS
jgi:hypothetical protein